MPAALDARNQVPNRSSKRKAASPPPPTTTTTTRLTSDHVVAQHRLNEFRRHIASLLIVQLTTGDQVAMARRRWHAQRFRRRAYRRQIMAQRRAVADDEYIVID